MTGMDCIPSGVDFLDRATGGFHRRKPYFVFGASGTGKSILGLQYVTAGLSSGEGALYVCRERAEDLIQQGERLGFPLSEHVAAERLVLLEYDADFHDIVSSQGPEAVLDELAAQVEGVNVRRVVFDPIDPFFSNLDDEASLRTHLRALTRRIEDLGWTPLMLGDDATVAEPSFVLRVFSEVCWGLCELRRDTEEGGAGHQLLVYKMRNVSLERSRFPFRIGSRGIGGPEAPEPKAVKRASFSRFRPTTPAPRETAAEATPASAETVDEAPTALAAPAAPAAPVEPAAIAPAAVRPAPPAPEKVPAPPPAPAKAPAPAPAPASAPAPALTPVPARDTRLAPVTRAPAPPADDELLDDDALLEIEHAVRARAGALPPPRKLPVVLVAAADAASRQDVVTALGNEVETVEASDGESALTLALARRPDLLVLHTALPRVNAAGVCRILRAHGADVPLLFLTNGPGRPGARASWLEIGADEVIETPIDAAELSVRARRVLERRAGVSPRWPALDPKAEIQKLGPQRLDPAELDAHVDEAAARARAHGLPLALLGYEFRFAEGPEGAQFADAFVEVLAGAIRAGDALARVGERRVAALLLDADAEGARAALQRVHERALAKAANAPGARGVTPKALYRLLAVQPDRLDGESAPGSLLAQLFALPPQLVLQSDDDRPGEPMEKYPLLEAVYHALVGDARECRSPLDRSRHAVDSDPQTGERWVEIGEFLYRTQAPDQDTPAGLRVAHGARIVWVEKVTQAPGPARAVARIEDGRVFRGRDA
jgi:KaiC/GvpD/RAD55 family RecA-like ATPase/DNA-binding response OmpR family regulator